MSYYMHALPGRLRIKSPKIKNNPNAEYDLMKCLSMLDGIATIDVNLITGSLLINYNSHRIKHDDILDSLQRKGYFDISRAVTNDEYIHNAASTLGQFVGKTVFGAFLEKAFEGSALSVLALLL